MSRDKYATLKANLKTYMHAQGYATIADLSVAVAKQLPGQVSPAYVTDVLTESGNADLVSVTLTHNIWRTTAELLAFDVD
jgi:hypothetical protein